MAMDISKKVYAVRKAKGLTMKEFATPLHISEGYISSIEAAKKVPSDSLIDLMISKYDISLSWWNTEEGSMFKDVNGGKPPAGSLDALVQELIGSEMDKLPTSGEKFDLAADLREFLRKRRG